MDVLVPSIRWASSAQTLEACRNLRSDLNTLKYLRGDICNVLFESLPRNYSVFRLEKDEVFVLGLD